MDKLTFQLAESQDDFYSNAKDDVVFTIQETLKDYEECRIGLSGGTTPRQLYEMLVDEDIPWEKVKLIIVDERYVPSDDPESNLRMIRESLLNKIPLPPENMIPFNTSLPPLSAAKEMGRKLIEMSHGRFPIFDLLVLGVGKDGHIASLFEGDYGLTCTKYACQARAVGYKTEERLTLSLIALKNASRALILIKGEEKRIVWNALKEELEEPKLTALRSLADKVPVKILYLP